MAIETRTINGSFTEIYVGGGNWITQSAPTNFHQFYKRKILTASENISDFKEVTEAQKAQIETADEKWERPPQSFIDEWKIKGGPKKVSDYIEETGYFKIYDITDISYQEALLIDMLSPDPYRIHSDTRNSYFAINNELMELMPRALFPVGLYIANSEGFFYNQRKIEAVSFSGPHGLALTLNGSHMFAGCYKLRYIGGKLQIDGFTANTFLSCDSLETINIYNLRYDLNFQWSSLLSDESIRYMVDNKTSATPVTITLHPEAYARVTDEIFAVAAEKNITIATT